MTDLSALLNQIGAGLEYVAKVAPVEDDSLSIHYKGTPAVLHALRLADGLDVIAITQVVAWDLPSTDQLAADVLSLSSVLTFGALKLAENDVTSDVLLHYTFPVNGLGEVPLQTMVEMVLSGGLAIMSELHG